MLEGLEIKKILNAAHPEKIVPRTHELLARHQDSLYKTTDRLFAKFMVLQWLAGILVATIVSPKTWIGETSYLHIHIYAAIFLGGILQAYPIYLAWKEPGKAYTRHVIATSQMLVSALLIHLSGGRIETHFHVFGSLAFIAMYRDWKVLASATIVVALDHMARGIFWPQSVFGVFTSSNWRWIEHAAWVMFENIFLLYSILLSKKEMLAIAERQANMEAINETIEITVKEKDEEIEALRTELKTKV